MTRPHPKTGVAHGATAANRGEAQPLQAGGAGVSGPHRFYDARVDVHANDPRVARGVHRMAPAGLYGWPGVGEGSQEGERQTRRTPSEKRHEKTLKKKGNCIWTRFLMIIVANFCNF